MHFIVTRFRFFIICFILFLIHTQSFGQQKESWKTINNDTFSIQFPPSWTLEETVTYGTRFILFAPQQDEENDFSENLNLVMENLNGRYVTLNAYMDNTETQLEEYITDLKMLEDKRVTIGNDEYHQLVYKGTSGKRKLIFEQRFWVRSKFAYVLTFTSQESTYDSYRKAAEEIMDTFNPIK